MKPQRNDPCPCGSGKKYKKGCLSRQSPAPEPADDSFDRFTDPILNASPDDLLSPEYWDGLERRLPAQYRQELAPIISQGRRIAEHEARAAEIEAAEEALEPYLDDYEKLLRRSKTFSERAMRLFREEIFASMRFHADDVQRAFDEVGIPGSSRDQETRKCLYKAIRFVVDDSKRRELAFQLISKLPDLVTAQRYIDACIVRHCAVVLTEGQDGPPGPFLVSMFAFGAEEWEEQRDREQQELLDAIGLTTARLKEGGLAGAEAFLDEVTRDPEKAAALEKLVDAHPELKALAEAQAKDADRAALDLLRRDDARGFLLLAPEEVRPWIPMIEQRLVESGLGPPDSNPSEAVLRKFAEVFYRAGAEMAGQVWTPPRRQALRTRVLEYRETLGAKDDEALTGVGGVLLALASRQPPQDNHFLTMICCESIQALSGSVGGAPVEQHQVAPPSTPPGNERDRPVSGG